MMDAVMGLALVVGLVSFMVLCFIITVLLKQLQALENKLMARDYTEYMVQSRTNSSKPGAQNYLKQQIERANRRRDDDEDDE